MLRIASLNVNGLRTFHKGIPKRRKIFTWIKTYNFDIVMLQETHADESCEKIWASEWGGNAYFSSGDERSRGVAILVKRGLNFQCQKIECDNQGRYVIIDCAIGGLELTLGCVYGPNTDNTGTFENVFSSLSGFKNNCTVIGGDFNVWFNAELDKLSTAHRMQNNDKCRRLILQFMSEHELVDIWRVLHPKEKQYTYCRKSPASKSRIDMFLVSDWLSFGENRPKARIKDSHLADHKLITLEICPRAAQTGFSYWKFNCALLTNQTCKEMIKRRITEIRQDNVAPNISKQMLLETVLCVLRGDIISFATFCKKQKKKRLDDIQQRISDLEQSVNKSVADEHILEELKSEMNEMIDEWTSKNMFHAKVRWRQGAERATKYFHSVVKCRKYNYFSSIVLKHTSNGQSSSETKDILKECKVYFSAMYRANQDREDSSAKDNRTNNFLSLVNQIDDMQKATCDVTFTEDEIRTALFRMKNGSSPGPSGYTAEFFKCFWQELKTMVMEAINEIFMTGKMKSSLKESITVLLPKKGKDKREIENLRPISLLEVIYKIITKALSLRLEKVLPRCINENQTGFIKGRLMSENIRLILDLMEICNKEGRSGMILMCDFQKAYDSIEWHYLKNVIEKFGFGPYFKRWINILYDKEEASISSSRVSINGHLSQPFEVYRGLRQGDPLSCGLFLLCLEPLLEKIRRSPAVNGLTINGKEIKLSAYADDLTLILDGTENSLRECISVIDDFGRISGMSLNKYKTRPVWIGKDAICRPPIAAELELNWKPEPFELLGVTISNDPKTDICSLNYDKKVNEMKDRLNSWVGKGLKPLGKVYFIKSEVLSSIIHLMSVLPKLSKKLIAKIETIMFKFIWNNKRDKIKRATLKAKYKNGGLKVPDVALQADSLKITWAKKLLIEENDQRGNIVQKSC